MDRDEENIHFMVVLNGLSTPITSAHFHNNVFGQVGGIIFSITGLFAQTDTSDAAFGYWNGENATQFTTASANLFIHDSVYVNVHTVLNPGGEIRGQVIRGADCFATGQDVTGVPPVADQVSQFALYPNPVVENAVNVYFKSLTSAPAKIQLEGITGNIVMTKDVNIIAGSNTEQLAVSDLPDGIYLVTLSSSRHSVVIGKLIKQ